MCVYGEPISELIEVAKETEFIKLMGCCVDKNAKKMICLSCNTSFD